VYIFYGLSEKNRRDDCDIQKITIYLTAVKLSFPPEYEDYEDIFFSAEYIEIVETHKPRMRLT
jgi:hypothetical protein